MRVVGVREAEDGEGKIAGIDLPAFFMFEKLKKMSFIYKIEKYFLKIKYKT